MLKRLRLQHGITIIVSTPYMDEAGQCDRIALMQDGEFLRLDTPSGIVGAYTDTLWAVQADDMHRLLDDLRACPEVLTAFSFGEAFHVTVREDARMQELAAYLAGLGHRRVEVTPIQATVEDCFMSLMKKSDEG